MPGGPLRFELSMSLRMQAGLALGAVSLALGALSLVWGGGVFTVVFGATAPALVFVLGGAPSAIEVHRDHVVLRHSLRKPVVLSGAELIVQRLPGELVLVHGRATHLFEHGLFGPGELDACAEALRTVAARYVVKEPRRPRR